MINIKNIYITQQMLRQIAEIDEFKGSWSNVASLHPEQLKALHKVCTIESIGSSNRIEGNKLSDKEVEQLLTRINKTSFKSRDEEEVAGYAELMSVIFDDYSVIPLSESYIKQLHQILLKYTTKDERHRGEYKKISNAVAAYSPDGQEIGIVFETATPFDTPRLMKELIDWADRSLDDPLLHPLIVIAVFIVHFLSIHPFQDGNGRLSRALTALLLLKKGYAYIPYSSLESIIEASKDSYYRSLRRTQSKIWTEDVDYEPWLSFFLTALQKQKRHLEEKIANASVDENKLNKTERAVLDLFKNETELRSSEISERLNLNIETTRKTLKNLVARGLLVKFGSTRSAWYEIKK